MQAALHKPAAEFGRHNLMRRVSCMPFARYVFTVIVADYHFSIWFWSVRFSLELFEIFHWTDHSLVAT